MDGTFENCISTVQEIVNPEIALMFFDGVSEKKGSFEERIDNLV